MTEPKWAIVPVEPTREMIHEGRESMQYPIQRPPAIVEALREARHHADQVVKHRAMLAASPPPPAIVEALHRISLASQNSMSSKHECGQIARKALAQWYGRDE